MGTLRMPLTTLAKGFPPWDVTFAACVLVCRVHVRGCRCADPTIQASTRGSWEGLQGHPRVNVRTMEEMDDGGEAQSDEERRKEKLAGTL